MGTNLSNTTRCTLVVVMLAHRLRRSPNIKTILGQLLLLRACRTLAITVNDRVTHGKIVKSIENAGD